MYVCTFTISTHNFSFCSSLYYWRRWRVGAVAAFTSFIRAERITGYWVLLVTRLLVSFAVEHTCMHTHYRLIPANFFLFIITTGVTLAIKYLTTTKMVLSYHLKKWSIMFSNYETQSIVLFLSPKPNGRFKYRYSVLLFWAVVLHHHRTRTQVGFPSCRYREIAFGYGSPNTATNELLNGFIRVKILFCNHIFSSHKVVQL